MHSQKCGDQTLQILREFTDDEMKMTLEGPGGVVSTRVYKKVRSKKYLAFILKFEQENVIMLFLVNLVFYIQL